MVDYKIDNKVAANYEAALAAEIKSCFRFIEKDEEFWLDIAQEEEFWAVFLERDGKNTLALAAEELARTKSWDEKIEDRVAFAKKYFNEERPRFMVSEEELAPFYYRELCSALLEDSIIAESPWQLIAIFDEADYKELVWFLTEANN